jgi:ribosomal protein S18 acetylase RimI-like enzyme
MPPWRDLQLCLTTVQGWITESINKHGQDNMVFIAEDDQGERLGFATVTHETHFTGERQAYIGELATSEEAEGRGVGKALLQIYDGGRVRHGVKYAHGSRLYIKLEPGG